MSAINHYIYSFCTELNKFCYGEAMVPLVCILLDGNHGEEAYGLFIDSKFDQQQKVDILNTALKVAVHKSMKIGTGMIKHKPSQELEVNEKLINKDTDLFLNLLMEYCYKTKQIPLLVILGQTNGKCELFDNKKFTADKRIEIIFAGLKSFGVGVRKELEGMKQAKTIDTNNGQIFKA